jgi:hypothetical protein
MENPYEVLGIHPDADDIVVQAAYQALVKEHHPDTGGDAERFKEIQEAYETIQNADGDSSSYGTDPHYENLGEQLFSGIGTPVSTAKAVGSLSSNLVIDKGPLTITLLGLFRTDITDLAWEHELDNMTTEDRFVAIFHVENNSDYVQSWDGSDDTVFIGDDSHSYPSRLNHLAKQEYTPLPPQYDTNYVDLQPQTSTYGILVPAEVPMGVDIDRIVYTHSVFEGHQTDGWVKESIRYEFDIEPADRRSMRRVIAGELPAEGYEETESDDDEIEPESEEEEETSPAATAGETDLDEKEESPGYTSDLSPTDIERVADLRRLEPTSNGELQDEWELNSGREVDRYLRSNLSEYFYRDEDKYIRATEEADAVESD